MRKATIAAFALVALTGGAAACGGDDDGDGSATTPATTAAPAQTQTQQQTATRPAAQTVDIGASEFKFTPSNVTVRQGQVTFELKNNGGAPHALEIEGQGIEEETQVIQGGQNATLRVNLKPGKYVMYCPVGNHRQQGMEGEVTVS
jgi:plastocyanin